MLKPPRLFCGGLGIAWVASCSVKGLPAFLALFCGVLGYCLARGSLGPSSASCSLRFLSALAATPIDISSRMMPVHMYRKSEVQMVVRMPSAPRVARILAVICFTLLKCFESSFESLNVLN